MVAREGRRRCRSDSGRCPRTSFREGGAGRGPKRTARVPRFASPSWASTSRRRPPGAAIVPPVTAAVSTTRRSRVRGSSVTYECLVDAPRPWLGFTRISVYALPSAPRIAGGSRPVAHASRPPSRTWPHADRAERSEPPGVSGVDGEIPPGRRDVAIVGSILGNDPPTDRLPAPGRPTAGEDIFRNLFGSRAFGLSDNHGEHDNLSGNGSLGEERIPAESRDAFSESGMCRDMFRGEHLQDPDL